MCGVRTPHRLQFHLHINKTMNRNNKYIVFVEPSHHQTIFPYKEFFSFILLKKIRGRMCGSVCL